MRWCYGVIIFPFEVLLLLPPLVNFLGQIGSLIIDLLFEIFVVSSSVLLLDVSSSWVFLISILSFSLFSLYAIEVNLGKSFSSRTGVRSAF